MDIRNRTNAKSFLKYTGTDAAVVATLCALFLALGLAYHRVTPLWSPPDEERHFAYADYIARTHSLPPPEADVSGALTTQAFHPPLYYMIVSGMCDGTLPPLQDTIALNDEPGLNIPFPRDENNLAYKEKASSARRIRVLSIAMSAITISLIYFMTLSIFPGERLLAVAAALFAGMNPQFMHISASVSNETLSTLLSTLYLFVLIIYTRKPLSMSGHLFAGVLLGGCLLSKASTYFYLPLTVAVITWVHRRNKMAICKNLFLVLASAALVAGWWYIRNWLSYNDPFLSKFLVSYQPWGIRRTPLAPGDMKAIAAHAFTSFWGNFDSMRVPLPRSYLAFYGCVMALGIAGLLRLCCSKGEHPEQNYSVGIPVLALLGGIAIFVLLNTRYIGVYMGRYLFVVLAPIAILTVSGIRALFSRRWMKPLLLLLALSMVVLNMDVLMRVLRPAYAATQLVAGVDQPRFSLPTEQINTTVSVEQSFVSPRNNLCAVRMMVSALKGGDHGSVTFSLGEEHGDTALHQVNMPRALFEDCNRYLFVFPPLSNSAGKRYTFRLSAPSLSAGKGIALWYEPGDAYPGGTLLVNSRPAGGDLCFTTYSFTGKHPRTALQGTTVTVIPLGLYLDIRELQLYYERSHTFREQTLTHEKWMRLEHALQNRGRMQHREN